VTRRGTIIGGALILGAAAYAYRWRLNYKRMTALPMLPEDIAGSVELSYDELLAFEKIADITCMEACCVDQDEIDELLSRSADEDC
jgi:hypothetical protein